MEIFKGELVKLNDLYVSAIKEEVLTFENGASNYPMEDGSEVTDFVQTKPIALSLNGVIVGEDAAERFTKLRRMSLEKTLVKYTGRVTMSNAIILKFSRNVDSGIGNGFNFDIVLQKMTFAKAEIVTINVKNLKIPDIEKADGKSTSRSNTKAKKKTTKGRESKNNTAIQKVDNSKLNSRIKELTKY